LWPIHPRADARVGELVRVRHNGPDNLAGQCGSTEAEDAKTDLHRRSKPDNEAE